MSLTSTRHSADTDTDVSRNPKNPVETTHSQEATLLDSAPLYVYTPLPHNTSSFRLVHILPGSWSSIIRCELHVVSLSPSPSEPSTNADTSTYTDTFPFPSTSTQECPPYRTLSYVWGDPNITRPILVDGCRFEVTLNLWSALRRLRGTEVKRMWIDALCINQRDNEERTSQVMGMGRTYMGCEEVVIWLGEGADLLDDGGNGGSASTPQEDERTVEDGTALFEENREKGLYPIFITLDTPPADRAHTATGNAFAVLHILAQGKHFRDYDLFTGHEGPKRDLARKYRQSLKALDSIMKRAYWNRIWVVQEGILPAKAVVVCGSIMVSWELFVDAGHGYNFHSVACCQMQWANLKRRTIFVDFSFIIRIVDLARSRRRDNHKVTLHWLLRQYFDREATDPRDKVYGLLGLVNDWGTQEPLVPDYNISTRVLFERLTMRIITETRGLDVLMGRSLHGKGKGRVKAVQGIGGGEAEEEEEMPSWVANWGLTPDAREWDWEQGPGTMYDYYSASGFRPIVAEYIPRFLGTKNSNTSLLRLRGVKVDRVAATSTIMTVIHQTILFDSLAEVLSLFERAASSQLVTQTQDRKRDHGQDQDQDEEKDSSIPKLILPPTSEYTPSSTYLPTSIRAPESLDEAYYLTLRGSMTYRPESSPRYARTKPSLPSTSPHYQTSHPDNEERRGYELWSKGFMHSDLGEEGSGDREAFRVFWKSTVEAVRERGFFVTEKGYLGLGPRGMREGDVVVVCEGGKVPFLVREARSEDDDGVGLWDEGSDGRQSDDSWMKDDLHASRKDAHSGEDRAWIESRKSRRQRMEERRDGKGYEHVRPISHSPSHSTRLLDSSSESNSNSNSVPAAPARLKMSTLTVPTKQNANRQIKTSSSNSRTRTLFDKVRSKLHIRSHSWSHSRSGDSPPTVTIAQDTLPQSQPQPTDASSKPSTMVNAESRMQPRQDLAANLNNTTTETNTHMTTQIPTFGLDSTATSIEGVDGDGAGNAKQLVERPLSITPLEGPTLTSQSKSNPNPSPKVKPTPIFKSEPEPKSKSKPTPTPASRKKLERSKKQIYTLIGDAYVHGIMDGEVFDASLGLPGIEYVAMTGTDASTDASAGANAGANAEKKRGRSIFRGGDRLAGREVKREIEREIEREREKAVVRDIWLC